MSASVDQVNCWFYCSFKLNHDDGATIALDVSIAMYMRIFDWNAFSVELKLSLETCWHWRLKGV